MDPPSSGRGTGRIEVEEDPSRQKVRFLYNLLVVFIEPLFYTQRFDEKKKLQADHDAVLQTIAEKLVECQQWQVQHKVSEVSFCYD